MNLEKVFALKASDGTELPKDCVVCLHGTWSGPCFNMLNFLAEESVTSAIQIYRINVGENPSAYGQFSVVVLPTVIVFRNGKQVSRFNGFYQNFATDFRKAITR